MAEIPFNRPPLVGSEFAYIREAIDNVHLSASGPFTRRCEAWLGNATEARAFLTHSCTAALEMAALMLDLEPGDEVIMPSFTFVSTASAFALRGAVPVFVDVRPDTLTIDEDAAAAAITPRTRAVVAVHYAGVACDMDRLAEAAVPSGVALIEDAAQALLSTYRDRPVGSLGDMAALSFHETKNVTAGEGGALLVADPALTERAEIVRAKGTDRARFFRGEVDKYTWVDLGSSYAPSELNAAFLFAQLEAAHELTASRLETWERYHEALEPLEQDGLLRRPIVPGYARHNAHLYYVLLESLEERTRVLEELNASGINAVFHYIPLHSSPAGSRLGRTAGPLFVTEDVAHRLIRLPLWHGVTEEHVEHVVEALETAVRQPRGVAST